MTITSPTFAGDPHVLTASEVNSAFATLTSAINALQTQVAALVAPSAPDLSGYVTQSQLTTHASGADTHRGFTKLPAALIPAGKQALFQYVQVTLAAGTATVTWPTSYATGSVVAAWAQDVTAANPTRVSSLTNTTATITGTGTDVVDVLVLGYI